MESPFPAPPTSFSLRGRPHAITLEANGLHHPGSARGRGLVYTPYEEITHLATSPHALWIATRRSVYVVARRTFVDTQGPEHLVRALLERIAPRRGGSAQLARMAGIEETARTPAGAYATRGLTLVCLAAYAAQLLAGENIHAVGHFSSALTGDGDWWRVVTGNLLHAFTAHLVLNLLGLVAIGTLVERSIGTARTLCVMVLSGVGSMAASGWARPDPVVGVSGVVFGLLGALLWLEFRFAEKMPAWWRVPRRALFLMLAVSAVLSLLPFVAGAGHAGGLVAGAAVAAALATPSLGRRPAPGWVRAAAGGALAVSVAAVAAAGYELLREGEFEARYLARIGRLPEATPQELNNAAWMIAIDPASSTELLEAALELALRAVDDTGRADATILDTLAEVHFQLGHRSEALVAIEEAIRRAPHERYYYEQRRRFLEERPSDDRPPGPPPELRPEGPGITV